MIADINLICSKTASFLFWYDPQNLQQNLRFSSPILKHPLKKLQAYCLSWLINIKKLIFLLSDAVQSAYLEIVKAHKVQMKYHGDICCPEKLKLLQEFDAHGNISFIYRENLTVYTIAKNDFIRAPWFCISGSLKR